MLVFFFHIKYFSVSDFFEIHLYEQMFTRKGSTDVHEFDGKFLGSHAQFKVTSVIGHVFRSFSN